MEYYQVDQDLGVLGPKLECIPEGILDIYFRIP